MTATEKKVSWKTLIDGLKSSQKKHGGNHYEDAVRIKKLLANEEFEEFVKSEGVTCNTYIDGVMKNTLFTSAELLGMLDKYPDRKQWVEGNLRGMREEMMRSLATSRRTKSDDEGDKDNTDRVLSWKQKFLNLEEKYKMLEVRYKQLEKDHRELQKSVSKMQTA